MDDPEDENPATSANAPTKRATVRRRADRGHYERAVLDAILDEALVCHVGVNIDGAPRVLPTAHVRVGDYVYLHGALANRLLCALAAGAQACITITLLDGLLFARSAFHHSMNYRSVVLHGRAEAVETDDEKREALSALLDHLAPGRSGEARPPTDAELKGTRVVRMKIDEASAKLRSGPPVDDPVDLRGAGRELWAGELPLRLTALAPRPDPQTPAGTRPAASVAQHYQALAGPGREGLHEDVSVHGGLRPPSLPRASSPRDASQMDCGREGLREDYLRTRGKCTVSCDPARLDFALVHRFLAEESYWARGISADAQRRAMQASLCFGLYEGQTQLGFARVVTDYGRFGYLADVFIVEEARGRGLGKWLVQCVLEHPALGDVPLMLLGTADAHSLYTRYGFVEPEQNRYLVRRSGSTGAIVRG